MADTGRLVARHGRGTGGVDEGEHGPPETGGQGQQPRGGPEARRCGGLAGLRDVADRGTIACPEPAAHAGVDAAAAVTPDLEGGPEIGGQPPARPRTVCLPRAPDL